MPNPTEQVDAVIEARELLARATQGPWRAVALLTDGENHHVLAGKFSDQHIKATSDDHNGLVAFADLPANTELIARAPELLKTLADEVEESDRIIKSYNDQEWKTNTALREQLAQQQEALISCDSVLTYIYHRERSRLLPETQRQLLETIGEVEKLTRRKP